MSHDEFSAFLLSWATGPLELSNSQKSSICEQYIEYHTSPYAMQKYFGNANDVSGLEVIYDRSPTPAIESFAKKNNLSRAEAITKIMQKFFMCNCETIFYNAMGNSASQDNSNFSPKIAYYTSSIAWPELQSLNIDSYNYDLHTSINYISLHDRYYLAELIYFSKEKGECFHILARTNGACSYKENDTIQTLTLGHELSKFSLMNEGKMITSSKLPIVLCHDKLTTSALKNALDAIITTFPGNIIENVDIKHLEHRDVIIVPLASKLSYKLALEQAIFISKIANSVRISTTPYILLESFKHSTGAIDDKFVDYVIKNIKVTKDFNIADLQKNSEAIPEYEKFLVDYGVMSPKKTKYQESPLSASLTDKPRDATKFELKKILSPNYISACYGQEHAGKTLFCYSLALSFAFGFDIFGFISTEKESILYIDGENSREKAAAKIIQIANGYGYTKDDVDKYVNVLSKKDSGFGSLLNSETQEFITARIIKTEAKLVVFDSLNVLALSASRGPVKWNVLLEWFNKLSNKFGISIFYAHHLSDKGEPTGAQEVRFLTHNYFYIYPSKSKTNNANDCHIELWMQKNKEYTKLSGHLGDFLLLESDSNTPAEPWKMTTPGNVHKINKIYGQQTSNYAFDTELSDRENEILHFISQKGWVSNADVVKHISSGSIAFLKQNRKYSSEAIRKELSSLVSKGLLQHNGNNTRRQYCLPSDSITY